MAFTQSLQGDRNSPSYVCASKGIAVFKREMYQYVSLMSEEFEAEVHLRYMERLSSKPTQSKDHHQDTTKTPLSRRSPTLFVCVVAPLSPIRPHWRRCLLPRFALLLILLLLFLPSPLPTITTFGRPTLTANLNVNLLPCRDAFYSVAR